MRRLFFQILSAFLCACLIVSCAGCGSPDVSSGSLTVTHNAQTGAAEIRAVWFSYIDLSWLLQNGRDRTSFARAVHTALQNIASIGAQTVFVHVRAFSDAYYPSKYFPWAASLTGTQGGDPGFDPLSVFCEEAAGYHVDVHAWINPFRICSDISGWNDVCDSNPARRFQQDDDPSNDAAVVQTAGGVYYDPASPAVQDLILCGVRELLENYPIRGIHIDDYFYPSQEADVDKTEYAAYRANGGSMPLDDWRRETINAWVRQMYTTVKAYGNDKVFSISPAADLEANRTIRYADVSLWCSQNGYCDWIIPQLYVGFMHETLPFRQAAAQWNAITQSDSVRLLFGLAAYKCGQTDRYAGSGSAEWTECTDILSRQIVNGRAYTRCRGFAFYSYSSFFGEKPSDSAKLELQSVTSVL